MILEVDVFKLFIPAFVIFVLFVLAISLSMIFKKRQHKPSCKQAGEMMGHKCECNHHTEVKEHKHEHDCCGKHH
jgi:hypothetical protein